MVLGIILVFGAAVLSSTFLYCMSRGCVPLPPLPQPPPLPPEMSPRVEFEEWDARFRRYQEEPLGGEAEQVLLERAAMHAFPDMRRRSSRRKPGSGSIGAARTSVSSPRSRHPA